MSELILLFRITMNGHVYGCVSTESNVCHTFLLVFNIHIDLTFRRTFINHRETVLQSCSSHSTKTIRNCRMYSYLICCTKSKI